MGAGAHKCPLMDSCICQCAIISIICDSVVAKKIVFMLLTSPFDCLLVCA